MKIRGTRTIYEEVEVPRSTIVELACKMIAREFDIPYGAYLSNGILLEDEDMPHGSPIVRRIREATPSDVMAFAVMQRLRNIRD